MKLQERNIAIERKETSLKEAKAVIRKNKALDQINLALKDNNAFLF